MWEFSRPRRPTVFDFKMGRARAGPLAFLKGFRGCLQTDGYGAYDQLGEGIEYAGCWSHARREFHRAHQLQEHDRRPLEVLGLIGQLYQIEGQARDARLSPSARLAERQEHSRPIFDELHQRIIAIRSEADVLPGSQLAKACKYALGQWTRLGMFLKHGELEIDNNAKTGFVRWR